MSNPRASIFQRKYAKMTRTEQVDAPPYGHNKKKERHGDEMIKHYAYIAKA